MAIKSNAGVAISTTKVTLKLGRLIIYEQGVMHVESGLIAKSLVDVNNNYV